MGRIHKYEVYHTTDASNVCEILANGFKYNKNDRHWLGDGFYFFLDKKLADDWATKDIRRYGKINSPSCIKCIVEVDENNLLDLRFLESYNYAKKYFQKFIKEISGKNDIKNANREILRCLFFNYLKRAEEIYCIIAHFSEKNNFTNKIELNNEELFQNMRIPYIETQMCINRNKCIVHKEVI